MWRAYRALESECRDKVMLETPYKDASGATRVRKSKLGRIQALIRYRNSLAHGYNQGRDKALDDLHRFGPVLESVLEGARFCTRYPLYHVPDVAARPASGADADADAGTSVLAYRLMGSRPSPSLERIPLAEPLAPGSRLFIYDPAGQRALGLGVFMDVEEVAGDASEQGAGQAIDGLGWDVIAFEGHTRTTMIYVSVEGARVEKQGRLDEWRALLASKAVAGKAMTLDKLEWHELCAAAARVTDESLASLIQSGRYIREVSIARPRFERWLDDFERSEHRAFVIAGDNGMGKSTLLARYAEAYRARGDLVLFYRAATLSDGRLPERVVRDLGVRNAYFEDFLASLASVVPEARRVRVIVDSLHEHAHTTPELMRAIDGLVQQAASYPFLRVLMSVRSAAYERLPGDARLGIAAPDAYFRMEAPHGSGTRRTLLMEMPALSNAQVAEAYERYRAYARPEDDELDPGAHVFRPLTPFSELAQDGATVALMRVPLFMRLLTAAFAHRPLPSALSFDQAMEPYMDHVVLERDEGHGGYPERRRFLHTLVRLLDEENAEGMARDKLYAVPSLAAHLENTQKDSAYVQLLELGILVEEWEEDRCNVRFAFDGLFEYLLAELHYPRIHAPDGLLALAERALGFKSLRAALVIIMRRAIRTGRETLVMDACDLCSVDARAWDGRDRGADDASALFVLMMRDLIVDLARFRDPGFEILCREIPANPSHFDVVVLFEAFDLLFRLGEIAAADRLAQIAVTVARALEAPGLQAEALFRAAHVDMQRGHPSEVFDHLDRADELTRAAGSDRLIRRIDLLRGRLLVTQGEHQRAEALFDEAYREFLASGELGEASVALRGLASIAARNDQLERAAELGREAIGLAERIDDRASLAKALNNLAVVEKRLGRLDDARRTLERSLAIKEELGDRASIATTALNLGALLLTHGELDAADQRWREALEVFEVLEHTRGCALALCNLGTLAQLRRDPEGARAHLERALALFRVLGDNQGGAHALWCLASLAADRDDLPEAARRLADLDALAGDTPNDNLAFQRACIEARIAMRDRARARDEDHTLDAMIREIERRSQELGVALWDVEDGPASTLLDAAQNEHRNQRCERARQLVDTVRAIVARRPYAREDELEQLARRIG